MAPLQLQEGAKPTPFTGTLTETHTHTHTSTGTPPVQIQYTLSHTSPPAPPPTGHPRKIAPAAPTIDTHIHICTRKPAPSSRRGLCHAFTPTPGEAKPTPPLKHKKGAKPMVAFIFEKGAKPTPRVKLVEGTIPVAALQFQEGTRSTLSIQL